MNGATSPRCIYCPVSDYSELARAAKVQGNVLLSVVVNAAGRVSGISVLKGAPFGLTSQAIKATANWRLLAGQKDGQPVSVRAQMEIAFHLLN